MDSDKPSKQPFWSKRPQVLKNDWVAVALFVAGVVALYFFMSFFIIRSYVVEGQSMATTLQNGDRLLINKVPRTLARITGNNYIPRRGDIVIFNQSGLFAGSTSQKQLIKRVIGLPGERVVVKNGTLSIYSKDYPSGFEPDKTGLYSITDTTPGDVDITLNAGEIFVCGDNRNNSEDSRYFGPLSAEQIVGKLTLRFLPLNKAQRF